MGEAEIAEFISITGASRGVALRMLDAAGGDLQEAAEKFFADGGATAAPPQQPAARKPSGGKSRSRTTGISSLAQLNQEEEDSDDDDHNEYYVGGEKSGQVVKGAPKDEDRSGDPIEGIFENARASGAREGRPEDLHPASRGGGGGGGFHAFGGRARTLAGGEVAPPESQHAEEEEDTAKELTVTIAFYANGIFTVNDGEPRRIDDPANLQFMDAISRGQCPPELDPGDPDVHIAVNLVRRGEDYSPPAQPRFTAFGGSGRKLTDSAAGPSASAAAAAVAPTSVASGSVPWEGADPEKPKTSIQLRLADGSRQVAEFNLEQTVGHIRKFIHAARPDMPLTFSLATAFPQASLTDDNATIESAGLANSVVIQKMN